MKGKERKIDRWMNRQKDREMFVFTIVHPHLGNTVRLAVIFLARGEVINKERNYDKKGSATNA